MKAGGVAQVGQDNAGRGGRAAQGPQRVPHEVSQPRFQHQQTRRVSFIFIFYFCFLFWLVVAFVAVALVAVAGFGFAKGARRIWVGMTYVRMPAVFVYLEGRVLRCFSAFVS